MVLDLILGVALIGVGALLLAQRHQRVAIARERGHGIKSQALHDLVAIAMIVVGLWSIASALI